MPLLLSVLAAGAYTVGGVFMKKGDPEKLQADCRHCPRRLRCDEVALFAGRVR
jgi:hypothetical protein